MSGYGTETVPLPEPVARHILRVFARGEAIIGPPHVDDLDWSIDCPGVTPLCEAWFECTEDHCPHIEDHLDHEDEVVAHGKVHQRIDGHVMVPAGGCLTALLDVEVDPERWGLGEHPVDFECEEGYVYLLPLRPRA